MHRNGSDRRPVDGGKARDTPKNLRRASEAAKRARRTDRLPPISKGTLNA